jgi:hypothetical protein
MEPGACCGTAGTGSDTVKPLLGLIFVISVIVATPLMCRLVAVALNKCEDAQTKVPQRFRNVPTFILTG